MVKIKVTLTKQKKVSKVNSFSQCIYLLHTKLHNTKRKYPFRYSETTKYKSECYKNRGYLFIFLPALNKRLRRKNTFENTNSFCYFWKRSHCTVWQNIIFGYFQKRSNMHCMRNFYFLVLLERKPLHCKGKQQFQLVLKDSLIMNLFYLSLQSES